MITECSLDFLPYPDPPGSDRHRQTLTQLVGRWAAQLTTDGQQLIPLTDNNILAIVSISFREQADSRQEMNLVHVVQLLERSPVEWLTMGTDPGSVELGHSAYPMTNWKWTKDEKITCPRGRLPCGRVTTFSSVVLFNAYTTSIHLSGDEGRCKCSHLQLLNLF
ncbi:Dystonin [Trichinella pseudospiralis]